MDGREGKVTKETRASEEYVQETKDERERRQGDEEGDESRRRVRPEDKR